MYHVPIYHHILYTLLPLEGHVCVKHETNRDVTILCDSHKKLHRTCEAEIAYLVLIRRTIGIAPPAAKRRFTYRAIKTNTEIHQNCIDHFETSKCTGSAAESRVVDLSSVLDRPQLGHCPSPLPAPSMRCAVALPDGSTTLGIA